MSPPINEIINNKYLPMTSTFYSRPVINHDLRNVNLLVQPMYNSVKYGFNSLRYKGAKYWNNMPDLLKCDDFHVFKQNVVSHVKACECGHCLLCIFRCS